MKWKTIALCAVLFLAGLAMMGCDDKTITDTLFRRYDIQPDSITFSGAELNQTTTQAFLIRNVSQEDAEVIIDGFTFEPPLSDFAVSCPGGNTFTLGREESIQCEVSFTPSTQTPQSTNLRPNSNVSADVAEVMTINSGDLIQQIESVPGTVRFTARGGQTDQRLVKVRNIGAAPLTITGYQLQGQPELFQVEYDTDFYGEISDANPLTLMPHDEDILPGTDEYRQNELQIFVTYSPEITGDDTATLQILNDTPGTETYNIPLEASSNAPCILVQEGTRIDFGNSRIGGLNEKLLTVQNCGNDTLEISQIEPGDGAATLASADPSAFFLIDPGPGREIADDGTLTQPILIPPGQSDTFTVGYAPTEEAPNTGQIYLNNNDTQNPRLELQLFGRGVVNECPTAIARATIFGVSVPPSNQVEAAPLQYLILDGNDSNDQDGSVVDWNWTIDQHPDGSVAELEDVENEVPDPSRKQLFLDLAGTYRINLEVTDDDGAPSCNVDSVVVVVTPEEKIHIQLVWNNPEDPDQTDLTGSDVDIHLLKMPIGRWFEQPYDNYFQNRMPVWSPEQPSLDIDDTNGGGPENINMDDPVPCTWYAVGVHYWRQQFGTAYTTVRIFIEGGLRYESPNKPLRTTGEWWDVARIHWPTGEVFEVDELLTVAPRNQPAPITDEMNESTLCGLGNE
jgi:hypothetical protein